METDVVVTNAVEQRPPVRAAWCPICDREAHPFLGLEDIAAELESRQAFFAARLGDELTNARLRDLTEVVRGIPAPIDRCPLCGTLIRREASSANPYEEDHYDDETLWRLFRIHCTAFQAKSNDYRFLLPPGAKVLEIGSYVGGFLAAASGWGWTAVGVDVGKDTTQFTQSLGTLVDPGQSAALRAAILHALAKPRRVPAELEQFSMEQFQRRCHTMMDTIIRP